ncbi:MAG: hypothetical protein R3F61_20045 [Myxococcota bacterium]
MSWDGLDITPRALTRLISTSNPATLSVEEQRDMAGRKGNDFTKATIEEIAKRAGYHCSKPSCGVPTVAAKSGKRGSRNIGVAAHIAGAAPGPPPSPRYDPWMTPEQRKSPENGIWLCQNHAKEIDDDEHAFPVELLHQWKATREGAAQADLGRAAPSFSRSPTRHASEPTWARLAEQLRKGSQRSWWKRLMRFINALNSDPAVAPHLPQERHQPGGSGFLWSYDDATLDTAEHAQLAYRAIKFFAQDELPRRVGDFSPHSHALYRVRDGDHWRSAAWKDRRRDLFEVWVEPLVEWALDLPAHREESRSGIVLPSPTELSAPAHPSLELESCQQGIRVHDLPGLAFDLARMPNAQWSEAIASLLTTASDSEKLSYLAELESDYERVVRLVKIGIGLGMGLLDFARAMNRVDASTQQRVADLFRVDHFVDAAMWAYCRSELGSPMFRHPWVTEGWGATQSSLRWDPDVPALDVRLDLDFEWVDPNTGARRTGEGTCRVRFSTNQHPRVTHMELEVSTPEPARTGLDPKLHLRLLEVEEQLDAEEVRSRLVPVTYVSNLWPGHPGTYRMTMPGGRGTFTLEVGDTKPVEAEIAAELKADFGDSFVVADAKLPPVPADRSKPFLTAEGLRALRRERDRLRTVLGWDDVRRMSGTSSRSPRDQVLRAIYDLSQGQLRRSIQTGEVQKRVGLPIEVVLDACEALLDVDAIEAAAGLADMGLTRAGKDAVERDR